MKPTNTSNFEDALASNWSDQGLESLAKQSDRIFVRSLDQLAEDNQKAEGRRLTAFEALTAYGKDILLEVISEGSALLCDSPNAAGRVLQQRRELLNLSPRQVAMRAGVHPRVVSEAEKSRRMPIREYERIASALGLDERFLSFRAEPVGNEGLAVRLRTIGDVHPRMTESAVSGITEAAWVAMTQIRLEAALNITPPSTGIKPSPNYKYPAYSHGYSLAQDARKRLGLGKERIDSLRHLCEEKLGIPLIQAELGADIAGVTVQIDGRRAIVLNLDGQNRSVYVRRSTIAHELGHLLYDVGPRLNELRVDDYSELERPVDQIRDSVEQRANAFSVEFIAPKSEVLKYSNQVDPVGTIMDKFWISFTAARYQFWNALGRSVPLDQLASKPREPSPEAQAKEAYTADFHPLRNIPVSRAGRFSAVVLRAAQELLISWQTAAEYLKCSEKELRTVQDQIRELFPTVFAEQSHSSLKSGDDR